MCVCARSTREMSVRKKKRKNKQCINTPWPPCQCQSEEGKGTESVRIWSTTQLRTPAWRISSLQMGQNHRQWRSFDFERERMKSPLHNAGARSRKHWAKWAPYHCWVTRRVLHRQLVEGCAYFPRSESDPFYCLWNPAKLLDRPLFGWGSTQRQVDLLLRLGRKLLLKQLPCWPVFQKPNIPPEQLLISRGTVAAEELGRTAITDNIT